MVKGFLSGFRGEEDIHPMPEELRGQFNALMGLALIMTENDIA
jgi:hypothetical protein